MRQGSIHRSFAPSQPFACEDGWVIMAIGNNEQFERLCRAMEHPQWAEDPRFASNRLRLQNREALAEAMGAVFRTRTRAAWIAAFEANQAPLSQILNVAEALADPQSTSRKTVWEVPSGEGRMKLLANALQHMSRTPPRPAGPPPHLGEHTKSVLSEVLGLPAEAIATLRRDKVIGGAA
jgi:formyl-CoA transferase